MTHADAMNSFKAEQKARADYFKARIARGVSFGNGSATQAEHENLISLKKIWETLKAA
jgi:hypothetical protein